MKNLYLIFALAFLLFAGSGFKNCRASAGNGNIQPGDVPAANVPRVKTFSDVRQQTPSGAVIFSQSGVSDDFQAAADEELARLFDDARSLGYQNNLNFSDYTIFVQPDCELSPEQRLRSIPVVGEAAPGTLSYDDTPWDHDPRPNFFRIYAPEMVIVEADGFISNKYVVCAAPDGVDAELREALRNGPEHIILKRNDEPEFQRTWLHINGIAHPVIVPRVKQILPPQRVKQILPPPRIKQTLPPSQNSETIDLFGQIEN